MSLRIGIVIPHIFMQDKILPDVIFSPGELAINLANKLTELGQDVTLFTPGPVTTSAKNATGNMSGFEEELALRGDSLLSLLKKHPLTFITLARQVQAQLLTSAYKRTNNDEFDIIHVYTNEEELGLVMSDFCNKPVVFTHHDPFNLLAGYRNIMPQYKHKNWLPISQAQKKTMPSDTNWVKTIYNSLDETVWREASAKKENYIAYIGRIIESKGTHIAIEAVLEHNRRNPENKLHLKLAGKYYDDSPNSYWSKYIKPHLDDPYIEYVGFISEIKKKQDLLAKAKALCVPSLFEEPFGVVTLEALACSTPIIALDSGALGEIIEEGITGFVVEKDLVPSSGLKQTVSEKTIKDLAQAIARIETLDPKACRKSFENRFTLSHMAKHHLEAYEQLCKSKL